MGRSDEQHKQGEKNTPSNHRQQNKLIQAVSTGEKRVFRQRGEIDVSSKERESFLEKLATGEISEQEVLDHVDRIATPTPGKAWDELMNDPTIKKQQVQGLILRLSESEMAWNDRGKVGFNEYISALANHSTPWSMEKGAKGFLNRIQKNNGYNKRQQYEGTLEALMEETFGKKYEYWQQAELLFEEARKKHGSPNREQPNEKPNSRGNSKEKMGKKEGEFFILEETRIPDNMAPISRRQLRNEGKIPFTIQDSEGHFKMFSIPLEAFPPIEKESTSFPDQLGEQLVNKIAEEIVAEHGGDEEDVKKRQLAFHKAVSADFNEAQELIRNGQPTRENKVRSELLRIFTEKTSN